MEKTNLTKKNTKNRFYGHILSMNLFVNLYLIKLRAINRTLFTILLTKYCVKKTMETYKKIKNKKTENSNVMNTDSAILEMLMKSKRYPLKKMCQP